MNSCKFVWPPPMWTCHNSTGLAQNKGPKIDERSENHKILPEERLENSSGRLSTI